MSMQLLKSMYIISADKKSEIIFTLWSEDINDLPSFDYLKGVWSISRNGVSITRMHDDINPLITFHNQMILSGYDIATLFMWM